VSASHVCVPLCLCASVPLCLCASVPLCLCLVTPYPSHCPSVLSTRCHMSCLLAGGGSVGLVQRRGPRVGVRAWLVVERARARPGAFGRPGSLTSFTPPLSRLTVSVTPPLSRLGVFARPCSFTTPSLNLILPPQKPITRSLSRYSSRRLRY
jgi:hypothetical protein